MGELSKLLMNFGLQTSLAQMIIVPPCSPSSYGSNVFVTGNSFFKWPKGTSTEMPASADISNWLVPSLGSRKLSIVTCMCSQHCLLPYMNMDKRGDSGIGGKNNYNIERR